MGAREAVSSLIVAALALACAQAPPQAADGLVGPTWQLVRFQGGDGRVQTPVEPSQYALVFNAGGTVIARIDCNRGSGSWKSAGENQIELGPMRMTRAMCPPGSFLENVATRLPDVRSYAIQGGRLFLSGTSDGSVYEFEPAR